MAYGDTFHPAGVQRDVKIRGPLWVGVFSLVTLGIYAICFIYWVAKDLSEYGRAKGRDLGQSPGMTLLAVTLGWIIIVPPFVAIYRQAKRIQQAQQLAGVQPMNGWLALVLYLVFSPAFFAYEQSELNKAWGAEGGPAPNQTNEAPMLTGAPTAGGTPTPTTTTPVESDISSPERPGA